MVDLHHDIKLEWIDSITLISCKEGQYNLLATILFGSYHQSFQRYETHRDSLVVKTKANSNYYSNISFVWQDNSIINSMTFNCVLNNTIRVCTLPVSESDHIRMYSLKLYACVSQNEIVVMCGHNIDLYYFPSPYLISEFRPPTRGGNITLSGYYLQLKLRLIVSYINNYKNDQYYDEVWFYRVRGDMWNPGYDRINLVVSVLPGCGLRSIYWENDDLYNFTYQDPLIQQIHTSQSIFDIVGTNFYNQSIFVGVIIDNKNVDPNDIITVDFENIKLKYNYSEPFSTKLSVQVSCCDYLSNKFEISYPPIPSSSNSIPKSKGGLLIINGNRLTSSSSNNNISVTVGDSICSNVSSTSNEIKCYLQPSNTTLNNIIINVSINGVVNTNNLLFKYDIPYITSYSQVNDEIQIIGDCFGNINSTSIQINGKQVSNQIISINYNETILKLKVPNQNYNFNVSIKSNSIKTNEINVNVNLYARINEIPSIGNKLINFTLFYVNSSNINSIPSITILNQQFNQSIKSILTKINETIICSFEIEYYCGIINYEIQIGNQRYQSSFSYESPLINQCNLNSSEIVTCIGSGFSSGINETTSIIISNQTILTTNKQINYNQSISFKFNEEYDINGELYLNVCGLLSNKVNINTIPIIKNVSIPNLFSTNGGDINIVAKYMNNNTNITIQCDNNKSGGDGEQTIEKECKLINNSLLSCNIKLNGPIDKTCEIYFNNDIKTVSTFNVSYKSPSINRTSVIYPKQGGILTINGNDFYDSIDMVTIGDLLKCNDPKFINHTMITCLILPTNNTSNIKYGESIYINVTINGKSGASKIFKYSSQPDEVHQYSAARNIFQNLLLSILIIVIISLLFTTTL
ncbi:hypothetical protein RB653_001642 [Dictyostelium firmibasis]|uniref:IPT/TIG domain-containing protein n=1 Tax=Dictyostelium firmibasis TaxID=79012 RepID=A0AAN7U4D7_9MYCE